MRTRILLPVLLLWSATVLAQPAEEPSAGEDEPSAGELSSSQEAVSYYAAQVRDLWAENARKLAAIDQGYKEALKQLSIQYRERLAAINARFNDEYKALAAKKLPGAEHSSENKRLRKASASERARLIDWETQSRKRLAAAHRSDRADQFEATRTLIEQVRVQREAVLERLQTLVVRRSVQFPDTSEAGTAAASGPRSASGVVEDQPAGVPGAPSQGGVDLAGTVPLPEPGREAAAAALARDTQLLRERAFVSEVERKRRAEEEAARRLQERRERLRRFSTSHNDQVDWTALDCNDRRADIHPGATEVCNYVDDDCDATVDEVPGGGGGSLQRQMYLDRDGDRHGDPGTSEYLCPQTTRDPETGSYMSTYGNDCDDNDPGIWTGCDE